MKQHGIIKLTGSYDDLSFFKRGGNYFAGKKGGPSKEQIKTHPNFVRVRENNDEFGSAARSAKVFRDAFKPMTKGVSDDKVLSRSNGLMNAIQKLDSVSEKGMRKAASGILTDEGKKLLKEFRFNLSSIPERVLHKGYLYDPETCSVSLPDFKAKHDLSIPKGATHFCLRIAVARIDFATGKSNTAYSDGTALPLSNAPVNLLLKPEFIPEGNGVLVTVLQVQFFSGVNGKLCRLADKKYNAIGIVHVGTGEWVNEKAIEQPGSSIEKKNAKSIAEISSEEVIRQLVDELQRESEEVTVKIVPEVVARE